MNSPSRVWGGAAAEIEYDAHKDYTKIPSHLTPRTQNVTLQTSKKCMNRLEPSKTPGWLYLPRKHYELRMHMRSS